VYGARWCGSRVAAKVLKTSAAAVLLRCHTAASSSLGASSPGTVSVPESGFQSIVLCSESAVDVIAHEVALLAQLRHPNIVHVYAFVREPSMLLMELATGGTLSALLLLSDMSTLPWPKRTEILRGIASGVEYLHKQQPPVIHLDLKPANVLMSEALVPRGACRAPHHA